MEWLIGIIAVVIVVYFWQIFLPLGVIAGLGLGVFLLYDDYQSDQRKAGKAAADAEKKVAGEKGDRLICCGPRACGEPN